jgi:uncharacterized membrane protein YhiD involved in acid resistance
VPRTAAGIWMTAGIGVAIGLGRLVTAAIAVVFAWFVLAIVVKVEAASRFGRARVAVTARVRAGAQPSARFSAT